MTLPLSYNIRNVLVRWRSSLSTILCVALVVAVCLVLQAMAAGITNATARTGDPANLMIVRKGSTAESSSQITLEQVRRLRYFPEIERDSRGPLVSADVVVLANLPRANNRGEANVVIRGVSPQGIALRPQVRLTAGRLFRPGHREAIVSERMSQRFAHLGLNDSFKTGRHAITVVGLFSGDRSAFDSELWMDADETRALFDRDNYSSVLMRVPAAADQLSISNRLESDKLLRLRAFEETEYYAKQTAAAVPIRILGYFLAVTMSIGAAFSAMNALYAAVGKRVREIGTLRVLGFSRRSILVGIVCEGIMLSSLGGLLGIGLALPFNFLSASAFSADSFSEIVFQISVTPTLALQALAFSAAIGAFGALLPAWQAAQLPVISALKAS